VPVSEFRKQKYAAHFGAWDTDKDGVVEAEDFDLGAARISERLGLTAGGPEATRVRDAYRTMWSQWFAPADRDKDGRISLDEVQASQEYLDQLPREAFESSSKKVIGATFDAMDLNGDGKISRNEYQAFLDVHGNPASGDTVWPKLDTDGDGYLARDEFAKLSFEFFSSDDPDSPGNLLFGIR
jgi:Ca2+-binding EF-hand superfamily protein